MNLYRFCAIVALLMVGFLAAPAFSAESADQRLNLAVVDVALQNGGVLQGQLVNAQGAPQSDVEISIETRGRQVALAVTDKEGYFSAADLRGGTYLLRVADEVTTCRVWTANTAPPSASQAVLLVTGPATRAQLGLVRRYGPGSLLVIGGAATVIVLAVTDDAS
jgi:hypothetical protein